MPNSILNLPKPQIKQWIVDVFNLLATAIAADPMVGDWID